MTLPPSIYYLGIDPGAKGAAVLLSGLHGIADSIMTEGSTLQDRWRWMYGLGPKFGVRDEHIRVMLEQVHAMPSQARRADGSVGPRTSMVGAFKLGQSLGEWWGFATACRFRVIEVTPAVWKRHYGLINQAGKPKIDKNASRETAQTLWPGSDLFRRVKDDGVAEAALLAEYGRRMNL